VQAYDLIMLIVLAMSTIFGAIKGFAWQVASIASVIVSYVVAYRFRFELADMIDATPPWNQFLAMLILYVGSSFVIWVGFRLLSGMIDKVRLKEFDRHLGAGFGFVKGLIYCLLITMFAMSLLGEEQQRAICQSRSGLYIAKALDHGIGVLPKELHDVVGPYLASLDDKLKSQQSTGSGETSPQFPSDQTPPWQDPALDPALGQLMEKGVEFGNAIRTATNPNPSGATGGSSSFGTPPSNWGTNSNLSPGQFQTQPSGAPAGSQDAFGSLPTYSNPPAGSYPTNTLRPAENQFQQPQSGQWQSGQTQQTAQPPPFTPWR
jgi:membrane protein required for colicin V production